MKRIITATILVCLALGVRAAQHEVSSAAEIAALKNLAPGDVVVFKNGTYDSQKINFKAEGAQGNPVTLKAETPGKVVFTGTSSIRISGKFISFEGFWFRDPVKDANSVIDLRADDSRIYDCAITGGGTIPDPANDSKWISLYGQRNTVERCSLIDKKNIGTALVVWLAKDVVPAHRIVDNYFTRPTPLLDENGSKINGQESLRIGTSDYSMQRADCLVEGNRFYRCDGETEVVSNKSCYNTFRNNLFEECQGALTLRHGNNGLAEGNVFIGNGRENTGGIRIIGDHQIVRGNYFENTTGKNNGAPVCMIQGVKDSPLNRYFQVRDCLVEENTIVNCVHGIVANYGWSKDQSLPVVSTTVRNTSIISDNRTGYAAIAILTPEEPQITWENNTVFGAKFKDVDPKAFNVVKTRPEVTAPTEKIASVKQNSGTSWKID